MTAQIAFVLLLLVTALIVLAKEVLPVEQVALLLVAALAASGVLSAKAAFEGFASETVVMLACVMVLSRRLTDSGLLARVAAALRRQAGTSARGMLAALMAVSAAMSSVITNTSTTAVLIPVVLETARRIKVHPGRFLMPVAFASMMGGSATLIGTSTNLAASGVLSRLGLPPFGVFEFLWVSLVVSITGIAALTLLAPFLLPRAPQGTEDEHGVERSFMTTFIVTDESASIGRSVAELALETYGITVLAVGRQGGRVSAHPRRKLRPGDRIILSGQRDALVKIAKDPVLELTHETPSEQPSSEGQILAEVILMPGARWLGQTLGAVRSTLAPDVRIIALSRSGQTAPALISRMQLRTGDILLLEGSRDRIASLDDDPDLSMLMPPEPAPPSRREGIYTLLALIFAVVAGATGLLPFSVALLLAVLGLVSFGRFSLQDVFGMISWRILILIGGMSSFGLAMQVSGAAAWLAAAMVAGIGGLGPLAVLFGLGVLTVLLTQPMSNAAAALTLLPVAIAVADQLGADARPFVVMVTLSASLSFLAPFEPALLLVYGPGQYKLLDFVRAGAPLTLMSLGILLIMIPLIWPFEIVQP
ncbi:SLC13 family permease [Cognatiyoonia sp. IB215182]|uniref:SLC13 family permease n=1 Tax=Cognatiyoonia sp. IB215182 TaxID=3097353 RepID=UPI002A0F7721|nr:SLC13 family permease [Cognatiyoonia sp. IB215182]MDX8354960.1 SLC13 family permease [Cognatiyoonia sp. IB215182]